MSAKWKLILRIILLLAVLFFLYVMLPALKNIAFPFVGSLIAAYLLSPVVAYLSRKMPRILAILLTYFVLAVIITILLSYLFPIFLINLEELVRKLPSITEKYSFLANEMIIRYQVSNLPESIKEGIGSNLLGLSTFLNQSVGEILEAFSSLASNIFYIVLIPFITFYFLKDSEYLKERLLLFIPKKIREEAMVTWYQIDLVLKRFIRGEFIVAVVVGSLVTLGLSLVGIKFAFVLGFIAGLTNIIPYLGPFIGAIPAVAIALLDSPALAIKVILVFFIAHQLESGVISPKIVGESVGLHPITIIFILLLAEQLFGVLGMFLAVPVASILIVLFNRVLDRLTHSDV